MRKAFNFYRSYYEVAKELKETDRAKFLWAILQRQFEGIEPNIEGIAKLAYISQQHSIESQVIGYEHKTGEKLTPIGGGSLGASLGGSVQVQGEVQGEEKVEVQYVRFDFKKSLLELNIDTKLVDEWIKVRKAKRAVNTETAFNRFVIEVNKSSATHNEAVKMCVEKSWAGFEADWYEKNKPQPKQQTTLYKKL
jgi:hypothetical protein